MIITQFIKAGWHTVPLGGELERINNDKKTLPIFEAGWKKLYADKFNTRETSLAGALTGKISNIVAIDCDNEATYNLFKCIDVDYKFHFPSKNKTVGGGTIIYKYAEGINTFSVNTGIMALDVYSDEGFIYLPGENNKTKEDWTFEELPEIAELPAHIFALLSTLQSKENKVKPAMARAKSAISNRLAPLLQEFLSTDEYLPSLFKILTPMSFRSLKTYATQGHLHPDEVPNGRGSEYMSRISAILGADISVSAELYTSVMLAINSMWSKPMDDTRLMATVLTPMTDGKVVINGDQVWKYDKHWKKLGFVFTSQLGEVCESFFDDVKSIYYVINYTAPYIKTFTEKQKCLAYVRTITGNALTETHYDKNKQLVRTRLDLAEDFGHLKDSCFNLFRLSQELHILQEPSIYKEHYKYPSITLQYLDTLVPEHKTRHYLLSFIRTKLTTFEYSPVILYFIGAHGSGKDTFVNILHNILGTDYIAKPDSKVFLEQYNSWMLDKYFVHLDEFSDKLTRNMDRQECVGRLKTYTGSEKVHIRAMRRELIHYIHSLTFLMTGNTNNLPIEAGDRRFFIINTPNRLDKQEWVVAAGGISSVIDAINNETKDFCYYLATEFKNLTKDEYVISPEDENKNSVISGGMPTYRKLVYYLTSQNFEELDSLSQQYQIVDFTKGWKVGKLVESKLVELYNAMSDSDNPATNKIILTKHLREENFKISYTTFKGRPLGYIIVPGLNEYVPKIFPVEPDVVVTGP